MSGIRDWQQDERLKGVEGELDAQVDDARRVYERIELERKRNDVQTARIKALAVAVEGLCLKLLEKRVLDGADVAKELAELRAAMAPVKVG